jgi:hypothetical protein
MQQTACEWSVNPPLTQIADGSFRSPLPPLAPNLAVLLNSSPPFSSPYPPPICFFQYQQEQHLLHPLSTQQLFFHELFICCESLSIVPHLGQLKLFGCRNNSNPPPIK